MTSTSITKASQHTTYNFFTMKIKQPSQVEIFPQRFFQMQDLLKPTDVTGLIFYLALDML